MTAKLFPSHHICIYAILLFARTLLRCSLALICNVYMTAMYSKSKSEAMRAVSVRWAVANDVACLLGTRYCRLG